MSALKMQKLAGVCALAFAAAGFAGGANAAVTTVYGGGSSLIAPYWRQAADCYGNKTTLKIKAVPPQLQTIPDFNFTGAPALDCATTTVNPKITVEYISTGSGTGQSAFFSHDPSKFGHVNPADTVFYPSVQYALSDNSLGATEVGVYNNGGTTSSVTVVAPGVTPGAGQYGNPHDLYGAMIQFPIAVDPVAIAYDPVYKKVRNGDGSVTSYHFNVKGSFVRADGSGGLHLDADTYCKIFNGQITNWNDPALTALNGGVSLKDPSDPNTFDVPLQIVGRFESSGTTSIFTRHIAAVCASLGGNAYANAATTLPAGLQGPHYIKTNANSPAPSGETLGKYTLADGSDGVAKYIDFTADPGVNAGDSIVQGRIGYVGPDFALPAVVNTGANTFNLNTASLKNSAGKFVGPSAVSASAAFGAITPPQSNANGTYNPSASGNRANPANWVQAADKSAPLANPSGSASYPIVGTTNLLTYQCLATSARVTAVNSFAVWFLKDPTNVDATAGIVAKAGLSPLPRSWRTAIGETFTSNKAGLNLNISAVGSGPCTAATLVGG